MKRSDKPAAAEVTAELAESIAKARGRNPRLDDGLAWLQWEYSTPQLLKADETVQLAKKLICRALDRELTIAQTEAYLRG